MSGYDKATYDAEYARQFRKDAVALPEDCYDGRWFVWTNMAPRGSDLLKTRLLEVHPDRRYQDFDAK